MFNHRKLTMIAAVAALAFGLAACGSSDDDQARVTSPAPTPVNLSGVTVGYMAAAGTYTITAGATMDVGDVTFSCAAGGPDCTVTVAADGMATYATDGGMATAANSAAYQAKLTMDGQRMSVSNAIDAATMAANALTAMSSDADVTAAQTAIDAAKTALSNVTALSASEVLEFQESIDAAEMSLGTANTAIADYRTHQSQLAAANTAVDAATMAANGLTAASTDAEVAAAQTAIDAAKAAVASGTMLTASETAMLNGTISTAETNLGTVNTAIANRKTHGQQLSAANIAVNAAAMAVNGLTAASTVAEVAAAQTAIDAAEAAVEVGTMLTAGEVATLEGEIAIAKVDLRTANTTIADYRTHQNQLASANAAVNAATMAVGALTINSTDAQVTAAETFITMAKTAIADGTMLTASETAALDEYIATAETNLANVVVQIAIRKSGETAKEVARLYGEASGAESVAEAAGKAAEQAKKDAAKYADELGVIAVNGDSGMATANAQKVLDANAAATQAAIDATAAKTQAQTAKTAATALPVGTTGRSALIVALDAAIEEADAQIKAAEEIRDGDKLKAAVKMVTGTDAKKPMSAADVGESVAKAIGGALVDKVEIKAPTDDRKPIEFNDGMGMTWAQIVGEDKVTMSRLSSLNTNVPVASIAGMVATDVNDKGFDKVSYNDGQSIMDSNYNGILGTAYCLGTDCKVDAEKLTGSWYFTPDDAKQSYVADLKNVGDYMEETLYARYGHWLLVNGDSSVTINTYAVSDGLIGKAAELKKTDDPETGFPGSTASYTGGAGGMSVHKTFDGNGKQTAIDSGAFTAEVSLTMKFGDKPKLGGTISNFEGSAVDSGWSVELTETLFDGELKNGVTNDNDANLREGEWTATAYGVKEKRPTGVFGTFDASFTDGAMAGAYSARK